MLDRIKESDWKIFRRLREVALERYCERVLAEMESVAADKTRTSHERYLAIWKLLKERDEDLADAFDDLRRSVALTRLMHLRRLALLSDEEMSQFSPDTQESVRAWLELRRRYSD